MGYFVLYMKSHNEVSDMDRKKYLNSLYGDCMNHKYGMLEKFNKAVGYGDLDDDIVKEYPVVNSAKVKSPESYKTPLSLLYEGLHIDLEKKGILKFVLRDETFKHPIEKYSYSTYELLEKLQKFLSKVYSNVVFEIKSQKEYRPKLKIFILDWFYRNMGLGDIYYTVELSSHRLLSQSEISFIENRLKQLYKYPFHIEQYWCETCYGYHKESPYHIEIVYD